MSSNIKSGFALAPILYLIALAGIAGAVLFTGYTQILRSNVEITADNNVRNQIRLASEVLASRTLINGNPPNLLPQAVVSFATLDAARLPKDVNGVAVTESALRGSAHDVGGLPTAGGVHALDPWGRYYIYCRWESPQSPGTGASMSILSAGADGKLRTNCDNTLAATGTDDRMEFFSVANVLSRAATWQAQGDNTFRFGVSGDPTAARVVVGLDTANADTTKSLDIGGDGRFRGSLQVDGNATINGTTNVGTLSGGAGTFNSLLVNNNASIGGDFGVTGNSTLTGSLGVSGATALGSLSAGTTSLGATSASTVTVGGLATINYAILGGATPVANVTLNVKGATLLQSLQAGSGSFSDISAGSGSIGGSLSAGSLATDSIVPPSGTVTVTGALVATSVTAGTGTFTSLTVTNPISGSVTGSAGSANSVVASGVTGCCVPLSSGGTGYGASSITDLTNHLAVTVGTYTQAHSADLDAFAALTSIGFVRRTGSGGYNAGPILQAEVPAFTGAVAGTNGTYGGVPMPVAGQQSYILAGNGTWVDPNTIFNPTTIGQDDSGVTVTDPGTGGAIIFKVDGYEQGRVTNTQGATDRTLRITGGKASNSSSVTLSSYSTNASDPVPLQFNTQNGGAVIFRVNGANQLTITSSGQVQSLSGFYGTLTGNASTATKLYTARNIGTSGDVTATATAFDGSADITIPMTVAKIQGVAVAATTPTSGQVLTYNGTTWTPGGISGSTIDGGTIGQTTGTSLILPDGTVGTPSLRFLNSTGMGLYRVSADTLGIATGGKLALQIGNAASAVNYLSVTPAATAGLPALTAAGSDTDISMSILPKGTGTIKVGALTLLQNNQYTMGSLTYNNLRLYDYLNLSAGAQLNFPAVNIAFSRANGATKAGDIAGALNFACASAGFISRNCASINSLMEADSTATSVPTSLIFSTAASGSLAATERMRIDSNGNVGIGATAPAGYRLYSSANASNNTTDSAGFGGLSSVYVNSGANTYANYGGIFGVYLNPQSGSSLTGVQSAVNANAFVPNGQGGGSISSLYGMISQYGVATGATSTTAVTNAYGLYTYPLHQAGTITNSYGVFLGSPQTGGTVTNEYGLYQQSTTAKNVFMGKVGIGVAASSNQLEVANAMQVSGISGVMNLTRTVSGGQSLIRISDSSSTATWTVGMSVTSSSVFRIASLNSGIAMVMNGGKVGIDMANNNNLSPATMLDVNGAIRMGTEGGAVGTSCSGLGGAMRYNSTTFTFESCNGTTWGSLAANAGTLASSSIPNPLYFTPDGSNNFALGMNGTSATTGANGFADRQAIRVNATATTGVVQSIALATAGTDRVTISNTGNVGLGVTPSYQLDIHGTGQVSATITDAGAKGASIMVSDDTGNYAAGGALFLGASSSAIGAVKASATNGASGALGFYMRASSSATALTNRMALLSNGNLGIGTSSPSYLLSLDGQAARTIGMERDLTAATAGQALTINAGGAYAGGTDLTGGNLLLSSGTATGTGTSSIAFYTSGGGTTGTVDNAPAQRMVIDGSGNVGIGTASLNDRRVYIGLSPNDTSPLLYGQWISSTPSYASNNASSLYASLTALNPATATGTAQTGSMASIGADARVSSASNLGTISNLVGVRSQFGISAGTGTVTNAFGFYSAPYAVASTISNLYGLYLASPQAGGTVTNEYGLYQQSATAKNAFMGSLGIATASPGAKLHVQGNAIIGDTSSTGFTPGGRVLQVYTGNTANANVGIDVTRGASGTYGTASSVLSMRLASDGSGVYRGAIGFAASDTPAESITITGSSNVGINVIAPAAKLDVLGAVKIGNDASTCTTTNAGAIRYTVALGFEACHGSVWVALTNASVAGGGTAPYVLKSGDTMTGNLTLPAGTSGAPSLQFSGMTAGDGLYSNASTALTLKIGINSWIFNGNSGLIYGDGFANHATSNSALISTSSNGTVISRNVADANPALAVTQTHASSTGDIADFNNSTGTMVSISQAGVLTGQKIKSNTGQIESNLASNTVTPTMTMYRFRAGVTSVQSGDVLGALQFGGYDGTNQRTASSISSAADGAITTSSFPTNLTFSTTPSGSITPTTRMTIDNGGNVSVGGTPTATNKFQVITNAADITGAFNNVASNDNLTFSADNSKSSYAVTGAISAATNSGVTASGNLAGIAGDVRVLSSGNAGTISKISAIYAAYGALGGTGTITNAYGVLVNPYHQAGTITNSYGIFLSTPTTGGTVTNEYGVYQQSATATNVFIGNVGIGTGARTDSRLNITNTAADPAALRNGIYITDSATYSASNANVSYGVQSRINPAVGSGFTLTGTQYALYGSAALNNAAHTGTITYSAGVASAYGINSVGTGGAITNAYGFYARGYHQAGTIANSYGVYLEAPATGGTVTNEYGVYQNSTTASNRFAGNMSIGQTTAPATKLDVAGGVKVAAEAGTCVVGLAGTIQYDSTNNFRVCMSMDSGATYAWQTINVNGTTGNPMYFTADASNNFAIGMAGTSTNTVTSGGNGYLDRQAIRVNATATTGVIQAVVLATAGKDRVTVDSAGNVGIGTTSPLNTLHVAGTMRVGSIGGENANWGYGTALYYNNSAYSGLDIQNRYTAANNGTSMTVWDDSGNTGAKISLLMPSSINTQTAPTFGIAGSGITALVGSNGVSNAGTGRILGIGTINNNAMLLGTNGTERIRILAGGNVGIGTSTPTYLLSLGGQAARTIGMERQTTAATAGQSLTINAGGSNAGGTDLAGGNLLLSSGTATGAGTSSIAFYTSGGGSSGTVDNAPVQRMVIDGYGRVGLGTTTAQGIKFRMYEGPTDISSWTYDISANLTPSYTANNNNGAIAIQGAYGPVASNGVTAYGGAGIAGDALVSSASNAGTITNMTALQGQYGMSSTAGGAVTNAYGLKIVPYHQSGIIANSYGVYLSTPQTGGTVTNEYGVYQASTTASNRFAGSMSIGQTSAPAAKLDVAGAVKIANDATACSATNAGAIRYTTVLGYEACHGGAWVALDNASTAGGGTSVYVAKAGDTMTGPLVLPQGTVTATSLGIGAANTGLNSTAPSTRIDFIINGGGAASVMGGGDFRGQSLTNFSTAGNAQIGVGNNGATIVRNVADANPSLVVTQTNASSTGDIVQFANSTGIRARIQQDGTYYGPLIKSFTGSIESLIYSDTVAPYFRLTRSRASTTVVSGDSLGALQFGGYDGTNYRYGLSTVASTADGAVTTSSFPTNLTFATTPSGTITPVTRMTIDNTGNVAINAGTVTNAKLYVNTTLTDPVITSRYGIYDVDTSTYTSNSSNTYYGVYGRAGANAATGVTLSGQQYAVIGSSVTNSAAHAGTISSSAGVSSIYGITTAAAGGTVTNAYGFIAQPYHQSGTITNSYGLYLATPVTGGTVTSEYGVYQASTTASNYYAGGIGIGVGVGSNRKLAISYSPADITSGSTATTSAFTPSYTAANSNYAYSISANIQPTVATGITVTGVNAAVQSYAIPQATNAGTINALAGLYSQYGFIAGSGGTIANAYGVLVNPQHASGTITNSYALYLSTPTTGGTVTNEYGVYQNSPTASNRFSGNMSIGQVTAPATKLDVAGGVKVAAEAASCVVGLAGTIQYDSTNNFRVCMSMDSGTTYAWQTVNVSNTVGNPLYFAADASNNFAIGMLGTSTNTATVGGNGYLDRQAIRVNATATTGVVQSIALATAGKDRLNVDASGRVGIGTASPAVTLDIQAPSPSLKLTATTAASASLVLAPGGSSPGFIQLSSQKYIYANPADTGRLYFGPDTTPANSHLTISSAGKLGLGVGNNLPSYDLSLQGAAARTIGMERTTGTTGNSLTINSGGAIAGGTDLAGGNLLLSSGTSTGAGSSSIAFYTANAGSTGTADNAPAQRMIIDGAGNIGVGTSPLNPNVRFYSRITASDPTTNTVTGLAATVTNTYTTGTNSIGGIAVGASMYSTAAAGATYSGVGWGADFVHQANGAGAVNGVGGVRSQYGINTTGTGTVTNAYGFYALPYHQAGTITNSYGLYLANPSTGGTVTNEYGVYQASMTAKNVLMGNTLIGATSGNAGKLYVYHSPTDITVTTYGTSSGINPVFTANNSFGATGMGGFTQPSVASGVTASGAMTATSAYAVPQASNAGTVGSLIGVFSQYGMGPTSGGSVTNGYGVYVAPTHSAGTITNSYGVYISSPSTGGTVTNEYGVYQQATTASNRFAGSMSIGQTSAPTAKLDVAGAVKIANDATACSATNAGAIRYTVALGFEACHGSAWISLDNASTAGGGTSVYVAKAGDTMTGALNLMAGAAGTPSLTFGTNTGTGFIAGQTDEVDFVAAGQVRMKLWNAALYLGSVSNLTSANNAQITMPNTGVAISRNIADASPALTVTQTHASSTGNILNLANSAGNVLTVAQNGTTTVSGTIYGNSIYSMTGNLESTKSTDTQYPVVRMTRARASNATVQSGDVLGALQFSGYDGANWRYGAASVASATDGAITTSSFPTNLTFNTTPSGTITPVERMRIDNNGNVAIGTTPTATNKFQVTTNAADITSAFYNVSSSDNLTFSVDNGNNSFAVKGSISAATNTGISATGTLAGVAGDVRVLSSGNVGTISKIAALYAIYGATSGTGTITNAYGVLVSPSHGAGTITNSYGIYLSAPSTGGTVTNEYGVYQQSATASNVFIGNVGIGTTAQAQRKLNILNALTDPTAASYSTFSQLSPSYTANNSYSTYGTSTQLLPSVASGISVSGTMAALQAYAVPHTSNAGTISNLTGVFSQYGFAGGSSGVLSNAYGFYAQPNAASGTITNSYGMYLAVPSTGGTVTNEYGIYQASTTASNRFAGNMSIGQTTAPATKLDVAGGVKVAAEAGTCVVGLAGTIQYDSANNFRVCMSMDSGATYAWQTINVNGTTGNPMYFTADVSNNFAIGMAGSGTAAQRQAIRANATASTGVIQSIALATNGADALTINSAGTVTAAGNLYATDQLMVTGTGGSGTTIGTPGAGTRMFFNSNASAFRAGFVNGTQWDVSNVGSYSVAMGQNVIASGANSVAMVNGTTASGVYSVALGNGTTAASYIDTAIGRYNVGGGTAVSWVATDALFEIGNGTASNARSNAFTVLKNGNVGILTATPSYNLSFDGSAARTIGMERQAAASTAGQNLILQASGAKLAGTDLTGGNLLLSSGTSTGAGTSSIAFYTASAGSTGTADNAPTQKMIIDGAGNIGVGTATPSTDLAFDGSASRTIGVERSPSAYGNVLTLQASGAKLASANLGGGQLRLVSGTSTGSGSSAIVFYTASPGTSGTNDSVPTQKMIINGSGNIAVGVAAPAANVKLDVAGAIKHGTVTGGTGSVTCNAALAGTMTYDSTNNFQVCISMDSGTTYAWQTINVNGSSMGNPMYFTADASNNFAIGMAGSGTAAQRQAFRVNATATTGVIQSIALATNGADALTINSAGTVTAAGNLNATDQLLVTGTYGSGTAIGTPGAGTRMFFNSNKAAFRAGNVSSTTWDVGNVGSFSVAMGQDTKASGTSSVALGANTVANGNYSFAMGTYSVANGDGSTALGGGAASGAFALAAGSGATAPGKYSTALGLGVASSSYADVAVGMFNVGGGSSGVPVATDPVFEVGIGANAGAKANALTVLKNGNVGILTATPTNNLSFDGSAARTIGMERQAAASTAGQNLTLQASGAKLAGTDLAGGNLLLSSGTATGTGTSSIAFYTASAGSTGTVDNAPSQKMIITGAGLIGIGTATPSTDLAFDGTAARTIGVETNAAAANGSNLTIKAGSGGAGTNVAGGNLTLSAGAATGSVGSQIQFLTAVNGTSGTTANAPTAKMTIATNGYVGVGTAFPGTPFEIGTSLYNATRLTRYTNSSTSSVGQEYNLLNSSGNQVVYGYVGGGIQTNTAAAENGFLTFQTRQSGTMTESMRVTGTGAVGIGTATPATNVKLDVAGAIKHGTVTGGTGAVTCNAALAGTMTYDSTNNFQVCISMDSGTTYAWQTINVNGTSMGNPMYFTADVSNNFAIGMAGSGTAAQRQAFRVNATATTGVIQSIALATNGADVVTIGSTGNMAIAGNVTATDQLLVTGTFGSGTAIGTPGAGTRMLFNSNLAAFRAGIVTGAQWDVSNIGTYSVAMGQNTTASGTRSVALGTGTIASGNAGVAMGNGTTASGTSSTSLGFITTASGGQSTALGQSTTASGDVSTAMGLSTIAAAYADVAMGRFNVGGGTAGSWVATDPLFEVGIGASAAAKANALTVLKNGNVGILTATPTNNLSFDGTAARTIGVEQAASGAGASLTLQGGAASTGATDTAGGDVVLQAGTATGTQSGQIIFKTNGGGGTGTANNTTAERMRIFGSGSVAINTITGSFGKLAVFGDTYGGAPPVLTLGLASNVAGTALAVQQFNLLNGSSSSVAYAQLTTGITANTAGAHTGYFTIRTSQAGTMTEAVRVTGTGLVGIGTATPSYNLSFDGSAARTIGMERTTGSGGSGLTLMAGGGLLGGTDKNGGSLTLSGGVATGAASSSVLISTSPGGTSGTADSAPTVKAIIGGNGYMLLGRNLNVSTPVTYGISFDGDSSNSTIGTQRATTASTVGKAMTLTAGGAVSGGTDLAGGNLLLSSGTSTGAGASSIAFYTAGGGSTGTADNAPAQRMIINGAGNVGIGTASPTANLHINDANSLSYGGITLTNNANKKFDLRVGGSAVVPPYANNAYFSTGATANENLLFMADGTGGSIGFYVNGNTNQAMSINSSSNVGIGIMAPATKLDVAGGVKVAAEAGTCVVGLAGTIQYDSTNNFRVCMSMDGGTTYAWQTINVNGTTGNPMYFTADASNNFAIGMAGSGTAAQRQAIRANATASTGVIQSIALAAGGADVLTVTSTGITVNNTITTPTGAALSLVPGAAATATSAGSAVNITGGPPGTTLGMGGAINITGGTGNNGYSGGPVTISAGLSNGNANAASTTVKGGNGSATGIGGALVLNGGDAGGAGVGGAVTIKGGAGKSNSSGGGVTITGGDSAGPTGTASSTVSITGGAGVGNINGGNVILTGGAGSGTGVQGAIQVVGKMGLNVALPTYQLSLTGQSAQTIAMERQTSSGAGQLLTLQSGGAFATGTDLNGGGLVLSSGIATGTGSSTITFKTAAAQAATATTDNTPATRMTITGAGFVGIGTTTPTSVLDVRATNNDNGINVSSVNGTPMTISAPYATNSVQLAITNTRNSGTENARISLNRQPLTALIDVQPIGGFDFNGYDGASLITGASITSFVDGTPATGNVPAALIFNTRAAGQGIGERLRIAANGNVSIGTAATGVTKLDVAGGIKIRNEAGACVVGLAGTIQYDSTNNFRVCMSMDGGTTYAWQTINVSGTSVGNPMYFTADASNNFAIGMAGTSTNTAGGNGFVDRQAIRVNATATTGVVQSIALATAGADALTIASTGNVVIGTGLTSTGYKLNLQNNMRIVGNAASSGIDMQRSNGGGTVVSGDTLGTQFFSGHDGSQIRNAASILAAADGTVSSGSMPGRLVFSTTPSGSVTPVERMRIDNTGNLGIGTAPVSYTRLSASIGTTDVATGGINMTVTPATNTGSAQSYAGQFTIAPSATTGNTNNSRQMGLSVQSTTSSANSGTLGNVYGVYSVYGGTTGYGGTTTNAYGFYAQPYHQAGTITNSYGMYLATPVTGGTVTNEYGVYQASATASNVFMGNVGVGGSTSIRRLYVASDVTDPTASSASTVVYAQLTPVYTANNSYNGEGVYSYVQPTVNSGVTASGPLTGIYSTVIPRAANAGTISTLSGITSIYGLKAGSGGAVTNAYGVWVQPNHASGTVTNSYGVYVGNPVSGGTVTNEYGFYQASGTAKNVFAGATTTFSTNTPSSSTTTGTVVVSGGVGIAGSVFVGSNVNATAFVSTSDRRLKDNIKNIDSGLSTIKKLRGVTFTWKKDGTPAVGLIAQEVEEVLPQLVTTDGNGMKAVMYSNLVAPIIEAIKELSAKVDDIATQLANLLSWQKKADDRIETIEKKLDSIGAENARLKDENAKLQALVERVTKVEAKVKKLEKKKPAR